MNARAAAVVRSRCTAGFSPELAIVLGSGMGIVADAIEERCNIPFSDIPGFPVATVAGHCGELHTGYLGGLPVVVMVGRAHCYEGATPSQIAHTVRTFAALGVTRLLLCNASGGITEGFRPGSIALVADHINLMWSNPLIGSKAGDGERFPDMSQPFEPNLRRLLSEAAASQGIPLLEGVYAGVAGPSYETPAEIRMLARLGADMVGMSTVPETIAARALAMKCAAISCITNRASGLSAQRLSHAEVLQMAATMNGSLRELITDFAARLVSVRQSD